MTLKSCRLSEASIVGNFQNLNYICELQCLNENQYVFLEQALKK